MGPEKRDTSVTARVGFISTLPLRERGSLADCVYLPSDLPRLWSVFYFELVLFCFSNSVSFLIEDGHENSKGVGWPKSWVTSDISPELPQSVHTGPIIAQILLL